MTINLERAATESRLKGDQEELRRVETLADALISEIRYKCDPYADSVTELDTQAALTAMQELCKIKEKAAFLKRKIREYEEALYGKSGGPR